METDNGFGLDILSSRQVGIKRGGYFILPNNSQYFIKLTNHRATPADAQVRVDGKEIGVFRIPARGHITIKRPAGMDRALIFVSESSPAAWQAGVRKGRFENGVVQVTFVPEKIRYFSPIEIFESSSFTPRGSPMSGSMMKMSSPRSQLKSGATILGDRTSQIFSTARHLKEADVDNIRTLTARIVVGERKPRLRKKSPLALANVPENILASHIPPRIEDTYFHHHFSSSAPYFSPSFSPSLPFPFNY